VKRALLGLFLANAFTNAQTTVKPPLRKATAHRANELTLARLRPGRDTLARAIQLNSEFQRRSNKQDFQTEWFDACRDISLTIDSDSNNGVRVIRTGTWGGSTADCGKMPPGPWKTGRGLRVGDPATKATESYGEPDSKSPSTKDGQPLELWYYAFDWAGPDVPQVMEVLCTREKDGQPGRVVEITLAAPSL
jgi:hypothetical protein